MWGSELLHVPAPAIAADGSEFKPREHLGGAFDLDPSIVPPEALDLIDRQVQVFMQDDEIRRVPRSLGQPELEPLVLPVEKLPCGYAYVEIGGICLFQAVHFSAGFEGDGF